VLGPRKVAVGPRKVTHLLTPGGAASLRAAHTQCQVGPSVIAPHALTAGARAAQRIMGVKYSFPSSLHLARECVDLITKIFVANPANRISIGGIRAHPWFLKNLPEELQARPRRPGRRPPLAAGPPPCVGAWARKVARSWRPRYRQRCLLCLYWLRDVGPMRLRASCSLVHLPYKCPWSCLCPRSCTKKTGNTKACRVSQLQLSHLTTSCAFPHL